MFEYVPNAVGRFPIPNLDLSKNTDKSTYDILIALVDKIMALTGKYHKESNPQMKTVIQKQVDAVDNQINSTVYELYGLTEDEIKIMEGSGE